MNHLKIDSYLHARGSPDPSYQPILWLNRGIANYLYRHTKRGTTLMLRYIYDINREQHRSRSVYWEFAVFASKFWEASIEMFIFYLFSIFCKHRHAKERQYKHIPILIPWMIFLIITVGVTPKVYENTHANLHFSNVLLCLFGVFFILDVLKMMKPLNKLKKNLLLHCRILCRMFLESTLYIGFCRDLKCTQKCIYLFISVCN